MKIFTDKFKRYRDYFFRDLEMKKGYGWSIVGFLMLTIFLTYFFPEWLLKILQCLYKL